MTGNNKGRKKYLTVELFEKFVNNDFYHLKVEVRAVRWLTLTILGALITVALIDRFVG